MSSQEKKSLSVMNVLMGIDPRLGGTPSSACSMWKSAQQAGANITGVTCVSNPPLESEINEIRKLQDSGINVRPFEVSSLWPRLSRRWGISFALAVWLFRSIRQYDIIQLHSAWAFSTLIGAIAAKANLRRVVFIPHEGLTSFDMVKGKSTVRRLLKKLLRRFLLRMVDFTVFSSQIERQDSIGANFPVANAVIYEPAFDDLNERHHPRVWPSDFRGLRIGYLGRFDPKKNIEMVLDAVAQTHDTSLRIAGSGPDGYRAILASRAIALGLADRVDWTGFLPAERLEGFFQSIDVLVMPSQYECFGRVAAEAMVHGLPAIVTNTTGISEIIARYECGIVIEPVREALCLAFEELRGNSARLSMLSSRSIKAAREELSLTVYGERIASIYQRLMARRETEALG